ncbi:hypothetical protein [Vibrio nigripulchritudo]|uniref:hypothetical protein n=1 Tax=Vibrio nigripulchritudo TaxID=28173 RepID=UPI0005F9C3A3|nr:hypothetical protein [Vibrio nigripulchritudo]KJY79674.1 hypothetical protein TW74_07705 [Vibrio nigripulchritudo]
MYNPVEMQGRFFVLNSFFRSYSLANSLESLCGQYDANSKDESTFTHIHNVMLCDTVISWCKLFGSDTEECHWKNLVTDHADFRKQLFSDLGISAKKFREYQLKVLGFRNKWVVHYEPSYNHDIIPLFEHMFASALSLHNYLRVTVGNDYGGPECMEDFGTRVVESLVKHLKEPHT